LLLDRREDRRVVGSNTRPDRNHAGRRSTLDPHGAVLRSRTVAHPEVHAPEGPKGAAFEWAQLVVALAGSLGPLLAALRGWIGRHPDAGITLEIDGDKITLDKASPADRRLVEAFLARHGGG